VSLRIVRGNIAGLIRDLDLEIGLVDRFIDQIEVGLEDIDEFMQAG